MERSERERTAWTDRIKTGIAPARPLPQTRILRKADQGPGGPAWVDDRIAAAVAVSQPTVAGRRRQDVEQGLPAARNRRAPTRADQRQLAGAAAARLSPFAGRAPPAGQARWRLRFLADPLVELAVGVAISYQTGRRGGKPTN